MDMDNDFLSSAPQDEEDTNLAWRHDIATGYNTFYGSLYESIIEVASNQNPSATKAFKAAWSFSATNKWFIYFPPTLAWILYALIFNYRIN